MNHPSSQRRTAQSRILVGSVGQASGGQDFGGKVSKRLRDLAEAGAAGGQLSPREVREVCEALRAQSFVHPTRFHGGAGC